jgi:hypothetical protein
MNGSSDKPASSCGYLANEQRMLVIAVAYLRKKPACVQEFIGTGRRLAAIADR